MIQIKSPRELEKMRTAGCHVGEILLEIAERSIPGTSTAELNEVAEKQIRRRGLESSFLG